MEPTVTVQDAAADLLEELVPVVDVVRDEWASFARMGLVGSPSTSSSAGAESLTE
jgi:hypothetical protein